MLERSEVFIVFIFSVLSLSRRSNGAVLKLTRFKISAYTFAGEYITEEIERQSRYNVVQIEVSFVSTGRGSDKS